MRQGFDFTGTSTPVEPPTLLEATSGDRMLLVEFIPGPGGSCLRETFDAEDGNPPEMQRQGWQAILDRFARHIEGRG